MRHIGHKLFILRRGVADIVTGPLALAVLPAMLLAAHWAGGKSALLVAAIALPAGLALIAVLDRNMLCTEDGRGDGTIAGRSLEDTLDAALRVAARHARPTACIMIEAEAHDSLLDTRGATAARAEAGRIERHLRATLRRRDRVFYLGGGRFGIALAPAPGIDARSVEALITRFRQRLAENRLTVRCGVALATLHRVETGAGLVRAAAAAMRDHHQPCAPAMLPGRCITPSFVEKPDPPTEEVVRALDDGEIRAWFQPQLSTDTGEISGVEALARWHHPARGILAPARFLPRIASAGLDGPLLARMLRDALGALRDWHDHGCDIARVGVNLAPENLRDPTLPDMIAWELDAQGLAPERLCIEVLESVVAGSANDTTARNIHRLAQLGCRVDLDDFGTGHASISSLRRFDIHRLKIDRSFVRRIDADLDQQHMVAAILTMADQLGLETLAEGVETPAEHARLAELGCGHAQGFAIARPMPADQVPAWVLAHRTELDTLPQIGNGPV